MKKPTPREATERLAARIYEQNKIFGRKGDWREAEKVAKKVAQETDNKNKRG